jgi:outer membrane protein insertion porin family
MEFTGRCIKNRYPQKAILFISLLALLGHSQGAQHPPDSSTLQTRVGKITITGNASFSAATLKGLGLALAPRLFSHKKIFFKPAFSFSLLKRDTTLVRRWYESNGFLKTTMLADTVMYAPHRARLIIRINEGPRTTITDVHVTGAPPDKRLKLTNDLVLQKNNPLKIADLNNDIQLLIGKLGDRGYLEATVNCRLTFTPDSLGVDVDYALQAGPHIRVGPVQIVGLHGVEDLVVRRELRFREKGVLTNKSLQTTINNLYAANVFDFVMVSFDSLASSDSLNDSSRVVRVTIVEKKFFAAEASVGYQTLELVRGRVGVSYDNFFRRGVRGFGSVYANYLVQGFDLGGAWPWIFGVPVTFNQTVSFFHRREGLQQSVFFSIPDILWDGYFSQLRSSLSYQLTRFSNVSLIHTLQTRTIANVRPPINPDSVGNPFTHSVGVTLVRDSRTDVFDPHRGTFSSAAIEVSGITGKESNHYIKGEGDQRVYASLGGSFVLASALRAGIERLYGLSTVVPIDQKFYIGGPDVMRGFYPKTLGPDSTGGTVYLAWNVAELRFPIYKWFGGDVFFDMGNLWNFQGKSFSDYGSLLSKPGLRYNAGGGLRVHLPIFILSLDVGFKLDKRLAESPYAIQFNLGNSF